MKPGWLKRKLNLKCFLVGLSLLFLQVYSLNIAAQPTLPLAVPADSGKTSSAKVMAVAVSSAVVYGGLLAVGSQTWYQDMPRTRFHFFNDNHEWHQVDKAGHFWSAFHESRLAVGALKWAAIPEKKAIWWGSLAGLLLQTPIEILDGYAAEYGASGGDLIANTAGSAALLAQYLGWHEVRVMPKYSFHTTRFADQRPNVLGSNFAEQMLKDYNGQTYWLTVDIVRFLPATTSYPSWLNIALGYGTQEMVYNDVNTNRLAGFRAYRQFYLAPDLNLRAIKTRSKLLKSTFFILSMIHLPAPALEYSSRHKFRVHAIYF